MCTSPASVENLSVVPVDSAWSRGVGWKTFVRPRIGFPSDRGFGVANDLDRNVDGAVAAIAVAAARAGLGRQHGPQAHLFLAGGDGPPDSSCRASANCHTLRQRPAAPGARRLSGRWRRFWGSDGRTYCTLTRGRVRCQKIFRQREATP